MKLKVQLVVCDDEGHEETFTDVVILEKDCERLEHLGLTLIDAKQILKSLQQHLVAQQATTFRPLNLLLTEPTAPELLFMETKWASLVSYGLTAQALKDFLPVEATLNATTVQHHTLAVAQRCEDELGEEQWAFVEGCPADWATLPIPDGPLTVGIDGGYVRNWEEKKQHFN